MKFQVGDHIEANELSDNAYAFTNRRQGWKGYVVAIDTDRTGQLGVADEGSYEENPKTVDWWVMEEYFDLIPEETCDMPDGNLFDTLFG